MRLRRSLGTLALALSISMVTAACGSDTDDTASPDGSTAASEPRTIGVVNLTAASVATNTAAEAIVMGGEHLGWDVEVGDGEGDPAKISQIMQTFVNDEVDAIFTLSIEAPSIAPQLKAARDADIPVIAAVYAASEATKDEFTAVYSPDYSEVGKALGNAAVASGVKPGKVLVQQYHSATIDAFIGSALDVLKAKGFTPIEAEIVVKNFVPSIQATARTLLQSEPDAQLFFGGLTASAPAALRVVEETKRTNLTVLAVFDTPDQLDAVRAGKPVIVVTPDYARSAFVGLDQLRKHFEDGAELDPTAGEGTYNYEVVTKENVPAAGSVFPTEKIAAEYFAMWDKNE